MKKTCDYCGAELERRASEQISNWKKRRFCNTTCMFAARRKSVEGLDPPVRVGKFMVYREEDGRPFILAPGAKRVRRMHGSLSLCERCGKEFFHRPTGSPRWRHCSKKCAGYEARQRKRELVLRNGGPKRQALDKWFSVIVRAEGRCRRCGTTEGLQCAHIVSRRYSGTRFSRDNAMCLCARCHMYFTHRPLEWDEYVTSLMGESAYADLKRRAIGFQGPLDRRAVAHELYGLATELDLVRHAAFRGATFKGIYDDESERAERDRNRADA